MSVIHDEKWYQDLAREKVIRDQLQYAHEAERRERAALEEGREEGLEKGISKMIKYAKKLSQKKEDVVIQLMQDYQIARSMAEEKVNRYWDS